jgi:pyruvate dehydrogenase E2 component (dihydrolipoamide acetyltransferase)
MLNIAIFICSLRSQLNSFQEASGGKRISVNDLVIKVHLTSFLASLIKSHFVLHYETFSFSKLQAAALALRKVPQCNSSWTDEYIRQ